MKRINAFTLQYLLKAVKEISDSDDRIDASPIIFECIAWDVARDDGGYYERPVKLKAQRVAFRRWRIQELDLEVEV